MLLSSAWLGTYSRDAARNGGTGDMELPLDIHACESVLIEDEKVKALLEKANNGLLLLWSRLPCGMLLRKL